MAGQEIGLLAAANSEASWFCCGPAWGRCSAAGGGACGNCKSGSYHCAWPNASQACFDITRPDRCGDTLTRRGCGHTFYVKHLCGTKEIGVKIADCGPDTDRWCGEQKCCSGKCATNRLIDLTPAAFSAIGSLDAGLIPVQFRS
ncbi:RlpA-like double-psi beta-barrel domain-containing protein [Amycolatopsis nigrescens]|uniref:RlpA-like double-psi beta-barrel domain-containing protein n=1 Tax=Amycolatopsis nigrescens TaxID=381445 RepID=UPI0003651642|nr:RlpA-like double-psi beta-barrel domain-containing protein [Amycolatopsis nigrescens]